MDLKDFLKTNKKYLSILSSNWIKTVKQFFEYWPRDYEDRTKIKKVSELLTDWTVQIVKWKVVDKNLITTPTGKKLVEIILEDEDWKKFYVHYINSVFWLKQFKKSNWYLIIWKPKFEYWKIIFWHPTVKEVWRMSEEDLKKSFDFEIWRIYPIYSELGWIKSSWFAKKIWENLDKIPLFFKEYYPKDFLNEFNLLQLTKTVKNLHFPESWELLKQAKNRLWFDKLLRIQLVSLLSKIEYSEKTNHRQSNQQSQTIYKIVGIAQKIYNNFWYGLREAFYVKKLVKELQSLWVEVQIEKILKDKDWTIIWKGDIIVNNDIILEVKSVPKVYPQHFKQIRTYLQLGGFKKWLLLNFGNFAKLEHFVFTNKDIVCDKKDDCLWYNIPERDLIKSFLQTLPFQLTKAQKKVIKQIIDDFHSDKTMMRLLQWDVGSWKTIVAIIVARYMIKKFWKQVAFLAPTEILAKQHYKNICKFLIPLGVRVELLVWWMTKKQKEVVKEWLKTAKVQMVVWTHAIIQEDVEFADLWLAIIDEQHRFWVGQRAFFKKFGSPHILQMTATPIPRSLALAFFGEFDVSIIDEMPAGRKPVYTKIIDEQEFLKLKPWILNKIAQWQQIYIITPLIEESEKLEDVKSVMKEYEEIQKFLPELKDQICLLHGKMKPKEKDDVMQRFKEGKCKILVSTTVIEVGVDVPQATVIIIKNAERFGLAQLHQLRWRVWRSDLQSYCFLITKSKSGESYKRLKAMEKYNDWFKLAELDMKIRGAWEMLWVRQSWASDIPVEILSDVKFLEKVQEAAKWLLERYPGLDDLDDLKKMLESQDKNLLV